jgi:hypothetical protein
MSWAGKRTQIAKTAGRDIVCQGEETEMECAVKDELEQHLSDIRKLATRAKLTADETEAAARAERFAIALLREHDKSGHQGKACPFATRLA